MSNENLQKTVRGPFDFPVPRLASENRQTVNIILVYSFQNGFLYFRRKRIAEMKIPGLGVEALRTVVRAAGNKQGDAHADSILHIAVINSAIIHRNIPFP